MIRPVRMGAALSALALSITVLVPVLSPPAQAEAEAAGTVAQDGFDRTVSSGWGSADSGGAYALTVPWGASASVSSGMGYVNNFVSGRRFVASLPTTKTDIQTTSSVTVAGPSDLDLFHSWRVRETGNSYYAVTYRNNPKGSVILSVSRVVNGTSTWLYGLNLPARAGAGSKLSLETSVTGTSPVKIQARAWLNEAPVPDWQLTYSDSSAERLTTASKVSIDDYVGTAASALTLRHDNVLVTSLGEDAPVTPTPTTPTATPTATTTPTTPATSTRGATLGSTSYSYPSNAVFVSPSGNDSAAGTIGAPLKTVATALNKVPNGGTIVLRAGTYHESIKTPYSRKLTIQNYPKETVWFDGSRQVTNWTKSGSTWVATGWTASFSNTMGGAWSSFVDSVNPMARYPDQAFIDGTPLKQVASAAAVTAGTFYVDDPGDRLIIGSDPTGHEVRASDLAQAINLQAQDITLQGFGVRRYATPYEMRGAILADYPNATFRQLVIQDNATIGLGLSNPGKLIENVTVQRNGQLGIGANKSEGITIRDSIASYNDSENFNYVPVAGGIKITTSNGVVVTNTEVSNNYRAYGLWLDEWCSNFTLVGNTTNNNGGSNIEVEISSTGVIANNVSTGGRAGIRVYNTDKVKIFNNHVGGQTTFGIQLSQDARWKTAPKAGFTQVVKDITISNNVFGCGKLFQFYALDGETNISADKMNITINGNLFSGLASKENPTMAAYGQSDNVTLVRYETPQALAAAKNSSWTNAQTPACTPLAQLGTAISGAQSVAQPLPADVAAAVGKQTGFRQLGVIS